MKRKNPKTFKIYNKGDLSECGEKIFVRYRESYIKKDGLFKEDWYSKDSFDRYFSKNKKNGIKRINPKTNKEFSRGDLLNDKMFGGYNTCKVKNNGKYVENWYSKSSFDKIKKRKSINAKNKRAANKLRGHLDLVKRINPLTNCFFKRFDQEGNKYFIQYDKFYRDSNGKYFKEIWTDYAGMKKYRENEKTTIRLANNLIRNARQRAYNSNAKFDLDRFYIQRKIETGFCEATGLPFELNAEIGSQFSPSIDRIDNNSRDYTKENTQVVLTSFNRMKHVLSNKELFEICKEYFLCK